MADELVEEGEGEDVEDEDHSAHVSHGCCSRSRACQAGRRQSHQTCRARGAAGEIPGDEEACLVDGEEERGHLGGGGDSDDLELVRV
eukprot:394544-Hanusia_phi.AAC.2